MVFLLIFGSLIKVVVFLLFIYVINCCVDIFDKMVRLSLGLILLVFNSFLNKVCLVLLLKLNNSWVFLCIIKWV